MSSIYFTVQWPSIRHGNISTGTLLMGASNAGGVGKNRDSRRTAGYRSMTSGVRTTTATVEFTALSATHQ